MTVDADQPHVVYVLTDRDHTDITRQGYVGVTRLGRERKRMSEHRYACRTRRYGRDWTFEKMVTILVGDLDECLALERRLRPTDGIGWNRAVGGTPFGRKR